VCGPGSDEGGIVLFCKGYWLAGVGGRGCGRRVAWGVKDLLPAQSGAVSKRQNLLNWDACDLKFLILSTTSLVVKMIQTPILNDHNNTICTEQ